MTIKCYLFTGVAKQLNHTYYSLGTNNWSRLYYNLIDFFNSGENLQFSGPFVYEVELESEDVFNITHYYLEARKFKVIRTIEFGEIVKFLNLSTRTRNELNAILNGTANSAKIIQQYRKTFTKGYRELTKTERYKFLAILSQNHYELPPITISRRIHIYYVRLLEFYNKPHNTTFAGFASSELDRYNKEILYGSRDFEILTNITMNEIVTNPNLKLLLQTRRLPKERFEEYCEYMHSEERTIFHASYAIAAGYKILPKYKKHFYPYLIYSDPELALEVFDRNNYTVTEFNYFYEKNYKIASTIYNYGAPNRNIKNTKEIFVKENEYKYI